MGLSSAVDVLRETQMFRNVDPKRLKLLAFMGQTLSYRAGERLFEKGDEGDAAFVVLSGEVEVLVPVSDGGETAVATIGAKEVFGEMGVLCDQKRTTAIAAKSDVQVLRLDRTTIHTLLKEFPEIALEFVRVIASRLEATTRNLAETRG